MAKARSKQQQMAAGAALAATRGERPKGGLKGASKGMVGSMSEGDLEEMAGAQRKKLPRRTGKGAAASKSRKKTAVASRAMKTKKKKTASSRARKKS